MTGPEDIGVRVDPNRLWAYGSSEKAVCQQHIASFTHESVQNCTTFRISWFCPEPIASIKMIISGNIYSGFRIVKFFVLFDAMQTMFFKSG
jgi:hypothetical protein